MSSERIQSKHRSFYLNSGRATKVVATDAFALGSSFKMDTIQEATRALTSKPAKRAIVNTVLLTAASFVLLFLAAIASALFFQGFVPDQVLSRPVYLQYGSGINPYGLVSLASPALKTTQDYDMSVSLSVPPSPPNTERGNFMVTAHLLDGDITPALQDAARSFADQHSQFDGYSVLFTSRRPALLPYADPIVSLASRVLFLAWNMLFPNSRTCDLVVPLAERMSFAKGTTPPSAAYIEVEAGQTLQTYSVTLTLTAQLSGLRYLMHHYRLPMYIIFTFGFWVAEIIFMGVAWSFLLPLMRTSDRNPDYDTHGKGERTKLLEDADGEGSDASDHPHSFPTYGRQPPLKHEPEVKEEDSGYRRTLSEIPIGGAEADDEDDEYEDGSQRPQRDSGIGTSYSEEGSTNLRRRGSRQ